VNFLFVGRIAPNKNDRGPHQAGGQYKRYIDARYRFIFVGRYDVVPGLLCRHSRLDGRIQNACPSDFVFTGPVPDAELAAYYRASSVYISLSEHEGFCVPLCEAMAMDVPVLAYGRRGSRYTWRRGRAVLPQRTSSMPPSCWHARFRRHPREEVLAGQRQRLHAFGDPVIQQRLASVISAF
jgi:glycosyltransferase involved in cell wall biosynthesis